jgi:hypothetical protein
VFEEIGSDSEYIVVKKTVIVVKKTLKEAEEDIYKELKIRFTNNV